MPALACPACNKSGLIADACPRCGCDLTSLRQIDHAAASFLCAAVEALSARQWQEALMLAARAWNLRHSAPAARIAFLAAGALGIAGQASRWRQRAVEF
jgi:hypothetical protein